MGRRRKRRLSPREAERERSGLLDGLEHLADPSGDLGDLLGGGIEIDMGVDQEYLAVRQHESGPIAPRPNTAVQLVMTATRLPRGVSGKR